ncbi:MAG: GTP-binding protein EngB [Candidatus Lokiarchaeota archaeon]|nr:GTP-binding protein EngB [Candidatus Lokiarchaeota archaeon]
MTVKKEVVMIGRSNVGKSSVFRLLTKEKVAIGKKPGTTTNFKRYEFNEYILVDFPGLGTRMSKKGKEKVERLQKKLIKYIEVNANPNSRIIKFAILIIDGSNFKRIIEKWESIQVPLDIEAYNFLLEFDLNPLIVINKIDKIPPKDLDETLNYISNKFEISDDWKNANNIIATSAKKEIGIKLLKSKIKDKF